jgi:hypothetical protein
MERVLLGNRRPTTLGEVRSGSEDDGKLGSSQSSFQRSEVERVSLTFDSSNVPLVVWRAAFDKSLLYAAIERGNTVFWYEHRRHYAKALSGYVHMLV